MLELFRRKESEIKCICIMEVMQKLFHLKLQHQIEIQILEQDFYTTSNLEQAKRWAYLQTIRRKKGTPIVTYYGFDENNTDTLNILKFDSPNKEWLNFVADNTKIIRSICIFD